MEKHPIDRAAEVLGSQVALAKLLGVSKGAVGQWRDEGRRVPAEHCPVIEQETRARAEAMQDPALVVTCEELRPDVKWEVLRSPGAVLVPEMPRRRCTDQPAEAGHGAA